MERNKTLDFTKCIAAFMVVFIHAQFTGKFGDAVTLLAQGGVLLFFMISGYFSYNANTKRIVHSVKHVLTLIFIAYLLNFVRIIITQGNLWGTLSSLFTVKHIAQFFILNISGISGVMWFLLALLYCYIIFGIMSRIKATRLFHIVAFIFLGVNLLFSDLLRYIGIASFSGLVRNFCITGVPFFGLGHWMHMKCDENKLLGKFSNAALLLIAIFGAAITIIESFYPEGSPTYTVGSVLMVVALFVFALQRTDIYVKPLNWIGNNCCFMIYILHPIVIHLLNYIFKSDINDNLFAIMVLTCTVLLSIMIVALKAVIVRVKKYTSFYLTSKIK